MILRDEVRQPKIESAAELFVRTVFDPEESLEVRRHVCHALRPLIAHGTEILGEDRRNAQSVGNSDLDVDIRFRRRLTRIEEAHSGTSDGGHDVANDLLHRPFYYGPLAPD